MSPSLSLLTFDCMTVAACVRAHPPGLNHLQLQWLVKTIREDWGELSFRVEADTAEQQEVLPPPWCLLFHAIAIAYIPACNLTITPQKMRIENAARRERVRLQREEREKKKAEAEAANAEATAAAGDTAGPGNVSRKALWSGCSLCSI